MPWIRLDSNIFSDAKLRRVGPWGALVFFAAITYAKDQGHRGGRIPAADFDAEMVALHINARGPSQVRAVAKGYAECLRVGLLVEDSNAICVNRWSTFQRDPTNADRQQRHRDRKKDAEKGERYSGEPSGPRVTERNEVTVDSTVRDGTRQTEAELPVSAPLSVVGGEAKPQGLYPGQRLNDVAKIAIGAILDRLCEGADGPEVQTQALCWRQLHRNGALDDATGSMLLDKYKKRFAKSIGIAKKKEGVG